MKNIIDVASNKPFIILNNKKQYVVVNGSIEVFLTKIEDGKPVGRRHYIYSCQKDDVLFSPSFTKYISGYGLILSGIFGTQISEIPFEKISEDSLSKFFAKASKYFSVGANTSRKLDIGSHNIKANTNFKSSEPAIAEIKSGQSNIFGIELPKKIVLGSASVRATSDLEITISKISKDLDIINNSNDLYIMAILKSISLNVENEKVIFKKKLSIGEVSLKSSINKFLNIIGKTKKNYISNEDPYLATIKILGNYQGMKIRSPKVIDYNYLSDPIQTISRASKFMTRDIYLEDDWYKMDGSPFLSYINNSPVAVVPSSSGYSVINPVDGSERSVDLEISKTISKNATIIYRNFPNKKLTLYDLFTFSITPNTIKDFLMISSIGIISGALGMIIPIATGIIFSSVIPSAEYNSLIYITFFLISITLTQSIFSIVRSVATLRFEGRVDYMVQPAIWSRLLALPIPFFQRFNASDLSSRANSIITIRRMLTGAAMSTILTSIFSFFQFGVLFYFDVYLAAIALFLTVIPVIFTIVIGKLRMKLVEKAMDMGASSSNILIEIIKGISKFKIIGGERRAFSLWADKFDEQNRVNMRSSNISFANSNFNSIYPIITTVILFYFVALNLSMTAGTFLAFQSAFSNFMGALLGLTNTAMTLMKVIPLYKRAKPILESIPEVGDEKKNPGNLRGDIKISNVSYRYSEKLPEVLKNISIEAKSGEFIAIVGSSGSGKSTLLRLLIGFDAPTEGSIFLDEHNINDLDIQLVRRSMGVVLQNGKLMPGDIFSNIIGPYNLKMEDAWNAVKAAGFKDDVDNMPMKLHTVVSEGGGTLSGGQQQRIRIARALVSKPRIIIFDSATSALDNKTQAIVIDSLKSLDATKIVISQRLSTIIDADRIYVLDNGELVEVGNYKELTKKDGLFAEFAKRQLA
jgi:ATP-binding cassette subfamily C protein